MVTSEFIVLKRQRNCLNITIVVRRFCKILVNSKLIKEREANIKEEEYSTPVLSKFDYLTIEDRINDLEYAGEIGQTPVSDFIQVSAVKNSEVIEMVSTEENQDPNMSYVNPYMFADNATIYNQDCESFKNLMGETNLTHRSKTLIKLCTIREEVEATKDLNQVENIETNNSVDSEDDGKANMLEKAIEEVEEDEKSERATEGPEETPNQASPVKIDRSDYKSAGRTTVKRDPDFIFNREDIIPGSVET